MPNLLFVDDEQWAMSWCSKVMMIKIIIPNLLVAIDERWAMSFVVWGDVSHAAVESNTTTPLFKCVS